MSETMYNPWTPLHRGDSDPLYEPIRPCHEPSPDTGSYICTRMAGHTGLHVAAYINSNVCCDAWGPVDLATRLPEGF